MKEKSTPIKIISFDIGGSSVKACLLDENGEVLEEYRKKSTPRPATPESILQTLGELASEVSSFDKIALGFPGYVRDGIVHTAPNLEQGAWNKIHFQDQLEQFFSKPSRVVNDADLQGLGIAEGSGLEMVMTLGTGFGTALLCEGKLLPHLELSHMPATKTKDFDAYIGEAALQEIGESHWNLRMERVLDIFKTVINYDFLFISGGNAKRLRIPLDSNIRIVSNKDGIKGGARLWAPSLKR